jgi:hypothetical protein
MRKLKRLLDVYRCSGFTPMAEIRGVFGDRWAVVITLRRRGKKHDVASAGSPTAPSTTSDRGASATSPAAIAASTSTSRYGGSTAGGVVA